LKTRDENVSGVLGQILNIPALCHPKHFPRDKYEYGSFDQNADKGISDPSWAIFYWDLYLPTDEPEVYANPLLAPNLGTLPPTRKINICTQCMYSNY
jgi:hypothetical protein